MNLIPLAVRPAGRDRAGSGDQVPPEGQRRIYTLRPEALVEVDDWLGEYRWLWENRLDALHTHAVG